MEYKPEFKKKSIRSFVIRSGRMTEGQKAAFDKWWPQYGLSLYDGELNGAEVFANASPMVVEVGFGMGDSLFEMAKAAPNLNFVGIEVHPPGVGRLINRAGVEGLQNLKVYMADAKDVLDSCIANASLFRFQLYFPDPWHKKKHNKRRIVQKEFVDLLTQKLVPGGSIHMATDWEEYAQQMLEELSQHDSLSNTVEGFCERPEFRPKTKFENRGEQLGHGVWDLLFALKR